MQQRALTATMVGGWGTVRCNTAARARTAWPQHHPTPTAIVLLAADAARTRLETPQQLSMFWPRYYNQYTYIL